MSTREERDAVRVLAHKLAAEADQYPQVRELAGSALTLADEVDALQRREAHHPHDQVRAAVPYQIDPHQAVSTTSAQPGETAGNRRRPAKRWAVRVSLDRETLENRDYDMNADKVTALCSTFEAAGAAQVNRAFFVDIPAPADLIPLMSEDWARRQAKLLEAAGWSAIAMPLVELPAELTEEPSR